MIRCCTRRDVLKRAGSLAVTAAAAQLFPALALPADPAPGAELNVAAIGCGGTPVVGAERTSAGTSGTPTSAAVKAIAVLPIEDGGNPRTAKDIRVIDDGFVITPFSEDGDANYKFRLDVAVVNPAATPVPVKFTIEWDDTQYAKYRHYVLLSQDEKWQKVPATIDGTRATTTVTVPPGRSRLSMHPPYDYSRVKALVGGLDRQVFSVRSIGKSLHGREIYAVEAGMHKSRPLVVIVRVHPYESIGSYIIEGMIRWLGGGSDDAKALLATKRFIFLPMPNPDGVAEGNCKRTCGGLNLNLAAASKEPEGLALAAYYREIRPMGTWDIHGFMHDNDGFGCSDAERAKALEAALKSQPKLFDKDLHVRFAAESEGGAANLGVMATNEFRSVRIGGSMCWYGRDADHLRRMGVEMLKAYAAQF